MIERQSEGKALAEYARASRRSSRSAGSARNRSVPPECVELLTGGELLERDLDVRQLVANAGRNLTKRDLARLARRFLRWREKRAHQGRAKALKLLKNREKDPVWVCMEQKFRFPYWEFSN